MISIIIPVFNAERYIERCVQSVIHQDFSDWELLLVNDGSSDSSKGICERLSSSDSRITVINQENKGASIARRVGIDNSHGEYLTFIDADDIIESSYLSCLYHIINKFDTDVAIGGISKHPENENVVLVKNESGRIMENEELFSRFFKYEFWGFVGKIYKRNVFDDLFFPNHTINEDYVVTLQIFQQHQKVAYTDTTLYHYLMHDDSLSHQKISKRALDEYYNKSWALDFCKSSLSSYTRHAEAQLAESCLKLIRMIKESSSNEFSHELSLMRSFLKENLFSLLCNKNLLIGLKFMIIKTLL